MNIYKQLTSDPLLLVYVWNIFNIILLLNMRSTTEVTRHDKHRLILSQLLFLLVVLFEIYSIIKYVEWSDIISCLLNVMLILLNVYSFVCVAFYCKISHTICKNAGLILSGLLLFSAVDRCIKVLGLGSS